MIPSVSISKIMYYFTFYFMTLQTFMASVSSGAKQVGPPNERYLRQLRYPCMMPSILKRLGLSADPLSGKQWCTLLLVENVGILTLAPKPNVGTSLSVS